MPSRSVERTIYARDGYRCRFCGCRVVLSAARDVMRARVPDAIPWGLTAKDQHGAFFALTATLDHLVPHSRGGTNEADNLLTTCWPCNFGRGDALIEEIGLLDPRSRLPVVDDWDGLARLLRHKGPAPVPPRKTAKRPGPDDGGDARQAWFRELDQHHANASARLLAFLEECRVLRVVWKLKKVLLVQIPSNHGVLSIIGIEPGGGVEIPWFIGPHKALFRALAEAIADAIPGAVAYETPKLWSVRKAGRRLTVKELLDAAPEVKTAIADFNLALTS